MNKLTSYEQLIAEKVQQAPVPDMADSIWTAIEQGLDGGNGGNGGKDQTPQPKNPSGRSVPGSGRIFFIAGCFVIGVIIFLIISQKRRHQPVPVKSAPIEQAKPGTVVSSGETDTASSNNNEHKIISAKPVIKNSDSGMLVMPPFIRSTIDPGNGLTKLVTGNDSTNLPGPSITHQPILDSSLIKGLIIPKRNKGIILSDSDYKIQYTKDSTKKG